MLQRLTDRLDAGVVLKRGFLKTIHYSYPRNRDSISYESARWPAQVCVDIRNGSAAYLNGVPSRTNGPIMRSPSNVQMIIFSLKVFRNAAIRIFRFLFCHEMWNIGIIASPITAFLNPKVKTRIRWLPQTRSNWFLSDPFGIFKDDKLTILCEDFDYRTSRGIISSVESAQTARPLIRPAIVLPVHTSYPYLIMFEGEIYCIPETANAREVALFKAVEFPNRWVRVSLLISDFAGVDCTVFRHNGSWWLFCVSLDRGDHALYVWHEESGWTVEATFIKSSQDRYPFSTSCGHSFHSQGLFDSSSTGLLESIWRIHRAESGDTTDDNGVQRGTDSTSGGRPGRLFPRWTPHSVRSKRFHAY